VVADGFDWMAFICGFLTALLLMFVIRRKRRPDIDRPPPAPVQIPGDVKQTVLKLRAEGRTIEAIKLVRERTGCDLQAAKIAVEQLL
jgi:hypothetical protein